MSDTNLSELLEKVVVWKITTYRGVIISWSSEGYLVYGMYLPDLKTAHEIIDGSYKNLEDSLIATKLL